MVAQKLHDHHIPSQPSLQGKGFRMNGRRFWVIWLLLAVGILCFPPSPASAWLRQVQKRRTVAKEPTEESVTLSGVIQHVTSKQIEILVDPPAKEDSKHKKNKNTPHGTWTATTPRGTKFQVKGEATPDYLRSGLLVQVSAKVEGREIKEPVHELTIVSKAYGTAHAHSSGTAPAGKANGSNAATLGSESSKIVGQLGRTQENKWLMHVREKTYRLELADDLTIKVALSNSHLIGAGDKIVIHGEAIQGKPGACVADDVEVTLARPLSAKSKPKASAHEPELGLPEKK
jgi:hypothetical protein